MARRIRLATHLSVEELEQRYRAAHEPHERTWWQILWLLARGQLAKDIAESTGYTRTWIGQIAKRYNAQGPDGHGEPAAHDLLARAAHALGRAAGGAAAGAGWPGARRSQALDLPRGGRLDGGHARPSVSVQRGWDYLQRLKQSRQAPRPRHALADAEQQDAFKKSSARS